MRKKLLIPVMQRKNHQSAALQGFVKLDQNLNLTFKQKLFMFSPPVQHP